MRGMRNATANMGQSSPAAISAYVTGGGYGFPQRRFVLVARCSRSYVINVDLLRLLNPSVCKSVGFVTMHNFHHYPPQSLNYGPESRAS
jgi:hypothetical protein